MPRSSTPSPSVYRVGTAAGETFQLTVSAHRPIEQPTLAHILNQARPSADEHRRRLSGEGQQQTAAEHNSR